MVASTKQKIITITWTDPNTGELQGPYTGPLPITIGRHSSNTIVPASSIISRYHAELEEEGGEVVLIQVSKTNKIFVNGEPVNGRQVLHNNSLFQINPFTFTITIQDTPHSQAFTESDEDEDTILDVAELSGVDFDESPSVGSRPEKITQVVITWTKPGTLRPYDRICELPVRIGRGSDNEMVLEGSNISRHHARLEDRNGELWIMDQGSRNGILINSERREESQLQIEDTIRIGDHSLYIKDLLSGPVTNVEPLDEEQDIPTLRASSQSIEKVSPRQNGAPGVPAASSGAFNRRTERSEENTILFHPQTDDLSHELPELTPEFPPPIFNKEIVPVLELQRSTIPLDETTYLALGGGLGSFTWIDHLLIYGAPAQEIAAIGFEPKPYGRYRRLCQNSQIPDYERLRSNSDSCPDNIWGWPGYAVREIWKSLGRGDFGNALKVTWQIFGEPTLVETYTPRSGDVFASIDREAVRIGWKNIWRHGRIKAIRKTDDGRYVVAYTLVGKNAGAHPHRFIIGKYAHLSLGYPAIKLLDDLYAYRQQTEDFKSVVNAYEPHEHVYEHLRRRGGVVLVRGRGIVASRIIQRIYEARRENKGVAILHLMRTPIPEGAQFGRAQRLVKNDWEFQPFNWPKACWSGDLRGLLEDAPPAERRQLLNDWGGTTTADRVDWQDIIQTGLNEGWYRREFGDVSSVERNEKKGKIITKINSRGNIQSQIQLEADFVIDGTGLESKVDSNPVLRDLLEHYRLERNPLERFQVANDFEIKGMRNNQGRMYAAGIMTLGGPYAAVDSFLGLQYAAQRSVDALTSIGAPGLKYLDGLRSIKQWLRWARGVQP